RGGAETGRRGVVRECRRSRRRRGSRRSPLGAGRLLDDPRAGVAEPDPRDARARMSELRVFLIGLRFHVKALTHSVLFLLTSVFMPLLVATVAYYMYKAGNQPGSLLYVSLGAAVYGIWSSTLFGSGGAIQWQRWQGTLEVLVSAPTPFVLVIAPLTL